MPTYNFTQQSGERFNPDVVHYMGKAFNAAWVVLCSRGVVTDENQGRLKAALAKRIIELDRVGDYDAQTLCDTAIASLNVTPNSRDH
jgi:hypothetical protein